MSSVNMRGMNFPDRLFKKFTWTQPLHFTGNDTYDYEFAGNSIWDPDQNSGGTRCTAMSYLVSATGPYRNYLVFASKCTVTVTRTDSGVTSLECYLIPSLTKGVVGTGSIQLRSQSYCKWRPVGPATGGNNVKTISSFMRTNKIWGKSKTWVKDEDDCAADYQHDPLNIWFWNFVIQDPQLTTGFNAEVWVKMEYYTMCFFRQAELQV